MSAYTLFLRLTNQKTYRYEKAKKLRHFLYKNNRDWYAVLWHACSIGNLDVVKTIIDKRGIHAGSCDEEALKQASWGGHLHVVKFLLSRWADPTEDKWQCFSNACESGNLHLVKYYIHIMKTCGNKYDCSLRPPYDPIADIVRQYSACPSSWDDPITKYLSRQVAKWKNDA